MSHTGMHQLEFHLRVLRHDILEGGEGHVPEVLRHCG